MNIDQINKKISPDYQVGRPIDGFYKVWERQRALDLNDANQTFITSLNDVVEAISRLRALRAGEA